MGGKGWLHLLSQGNLWIPLLLFSKIINFFLFLKERNIQIQTFFILKTGKELRSFWSFGMDSFSALTPPKTCSMLSSQVAALEMQAPTAAASYQRCLQEGAVCNSCRTTSPGHFLAHRKTTATSSCKPTPGGLQRPELEGNRKNSKRKNC